MRKASFVTVTVLALAILSSSAAWAQWEKRDDTKGACGCKYTAPKGWGKLERDSGAGEREWIAKSKKKDAQLRLTLAEKSGELADLMVGGMDFVEVDGWTCAEGGGEDGEWFWISCGQATDEHYLVVVVSAEDPKTLKKLGGVKALVKAAKGIEGLGGGGGGGGGGLMTVSQDDVSFQAPSGWEVKTLDSWHAEVVSPDRSGSLAVAAVPPQTGEPEALLSVLVSGGKARSHGDWTCAEGNSPENKKLKIAVCLHVMDDPAQIVAVGLSGESSLYKSLGGLDFVKQVAPTVKGLRAPVAAE